MLIVEELELSKFRLLLKADDKFQRKKGLDELLKVVFKRETCLEDSELLEIWENVHKLLVHILNDESEACRDTALDIIKLFLTSLAPADKHVIYTIPMLTNRLGSQELIESSEEVRLKSVALLSTIIPIYKDFLPAYFEDLVAILRKTVADQYPNIKKESCSCISILAKTAPRYFYHHSESFVKPILSNFSHQHYKVRVISVKTIGDVLLYGNSKSMEEVATPLAEKLFDQSSAVRSAVVEVAGCWIIELRDRYSWWHKVLPLIMTGLHDEIPETRARAAELWEKAGIQYMHENESDDKLKNKMDFLTDHPEHYPPNIKRPNLGCRVISQQNLCKLVGAIGRELDDWLADIRVRSAQLLCELILHVEHSATQHIEKLLPSMFRACNDEDYRVVENVKKAAEYIGFFIPPEVYCELILQFFEDNLSTGHLRVFGSILLGTNRKALVPHLEQLGNFLQQKHVCQSRKTNYQKELLFCCESLLLVCKEDCSMISKNLFQTIFSILSTTTNTLVENEAKQLLEELAKVNNLKNLDQLFLNNIDTILIELRTGCEFWNIYTPEFNIFRGCFSHASSVIGHFLNLVGPIFEETMNENVNAEVRLKQFILLSEYLNSQRDGCVINENEEEFTNFIDLLFKKIIVPGLVWSVGRTAESIRTASVCCLSSLLFKILNDIHFEERAIKGSNEKNNTGALKLFITNDYFSEFFKKIIPILTTLIDDNSKKTRLYSLEAVSLMMRIGLKLDYVTEEHIHGVYFVVLKRLDDGCDDVRCAAVRALKEVWKSVPKNYDLNSCRGHVDTLYTSTLIHLDDPERKFQDLVLEALMDLGHVHPALLLKKIENCRSNFRNQEGLDQLMARMHEYLNKA